MRIFFKWTLQAFILFGGILFLLSIAGQGDISGLPLNILAVIFGALLMGLFFYLLEVNYVPWSKRRLHEKVTKTFLVETMTENTCHCKLNGFDIFIEIQFELKLSQYAANTAIAYFYVPRQQIDHLPKMPNLKTITAEFRDQEVYLIEESNALRLPLIKKRLEKRLNK